MLTHMNTCAWIHIHMYMRTHIHTLMSTHIYTQTHIHGYTCTYEHTCTHNETLIEFKKTCWSNCFFFFKASIFPFLPRKAKPLTAGICGKLVGLGIEWVPPCTKAGPLLGRGRLLVCDNRNVIRDHSRTWVCISPTRLDHKQEREMLP